MADPNRGKERKGGRKEMERRMKGKILPRGVIEKRPV